MKKDSIFFAQRAIVKLLCLILTILSVSFTCFSWGCASVKKTILTEGTFSDYLYIQHTFTDAWGAKKLLNTPTWDLGFFI